MEGPRPVKKDELANLTDLINYVFRVSSNQEPDMHICFPLFISEKNLGNLLVYVDEKTRKPVSHMGTWINDFNYFGQALKVGYLGSVCTDPNYRGKGLASCLLKEVFTHLEENGVDLLLVSGGRGLYQRAGCKPVGKVSWHIVPKQPLKLDLDIIENPSTEYLNELWVKEPLHTKRSLKTFETLVNAAALARCIKSESKVYLACVGYIPVAYVQGVHRKDGTTLIYEWAGDRTAVSQLACHIANISQNEVKFPIPSWETMLLGLMGKMNAVITATEALSGTYKIIRFGSFIDKISNYLTELFGAEKLIGFDEGNHQVLQYQDEELRLVPEEMLSLLFSGIFPENLPPKMTSLFKKALPLPLPWPIGFDYI